MPALVIDRDAAGIATLTLNRPEVHNALNVATYGDLPDLVRDLDADPSVKGVVLRGAGQRSFAERDVAWLCRPGSRADRQYRSNR